MSPRLGDPDALLAAIAADVCAVEQELELQVASAVGLVEQVNRHTLQSGGKRLRPALVALSAKATGRPFDPARTRRIGACMEMIHMATLIHDDVIDHAATRRGRPTAGSIHGNTAAILAGDVLLARAMAILGDDGDLEIIRMTSRAVADLAEGEVRELQTRGRFDLDEAEHLEVLRMKTASFIRCCCEAGALIAQASPEQRHALSQFGHHLGMAFQIVDDVLDYRSDATGKPKAGDFREGQATLPLIALRPRLTADEEDLTRRRFGNGVSDEELRRIVGWLEDRGSFAEAEGRARSHAEAAISALEPLPESEAKHLLGEAARFVLSRQA